MRIMIQSRLLVAKKVLSAMCDERGNLNLEKICVKVRLQ